MARRRPLDPHDLDAETELMAACRTADTSSWAVWATAHNMHGAPRTATPEQERALAEHHLAAVYEMVGHVVDRDEAARILDAIWARRRASGDTRRGHWQDDHGITITHRTNKETSNDR